MPGHKFVCEACGILSAKEEFGYLEILSPYSSVEARPERVYLCNAHKAQLETFSEDRRWVALFELQHDQEEVEDICFEGARLASPFL